MNYILLVAVIISIIWLIFASYNKLSVLISAPIATAIVVIFARFDLVESILGTTQSYTYYLSDFVKNYLFIFVLGSTMAKYLQKSGAIETITTTVTRVIDIHNPMHGMIAVFLITAFLTYGGVSLFVVMFAVVPLARSLFKQMNIPWKLSPLPIILGFGTFTASMLPGSPSIVNIIPTRELNTNLMAAPVMGIITSVVCVLASIFYMKMVVRKYRTESRIETLSSIPEIRNMNQPSLFLSLLPLVALTLLIILGSSLKIGNILIIALLLVILLEMVIYHPFLVSHIEIVNSGISDSLVPLLSTGSTIAFGQFVANIPVISDLTRKIINSGTSKLFMAVIVTIAFSVITGSASGAIGIVMASQGKFLLSTGLNAEIVHRVLAISSTLFTNTPHSGVVIALLTLSNLTHKESLKHIFFGPAFANGLALIVALLISVVS